MTQVLQQIWCKWGWNVQNCFCCCVTLNERRFHSVRLFQLETKSLPACRRPLRSSLLRLNITLLSCFLSANNGTFCSVHKADLWACSSTVFWLKSKAKHHHHHHQCFQLFPHCQLIQKQTSPWHPSVCCQLCLTKSCQETVFTMKLWQQELISAVQMEHEA